MQYENYEKRVAKIANVFKLMFRHMGKIIVSLSVIMAAVVTLLATRGIITSTGSCPEEIYYGEELDYSAKAFISKVSYEYCVSGTDRWTTEVPEDPGEYNVRAAAKALFGYRYGDVETFVINPREVDVSIVSDSVTYGEDPEIAVDLAFDDVIAEKNFIYEYGSDKTNAVLDLDTFRITNASGNDVTSRYVFKTAPKDIVTVKRPITIQSADKEKVYDAEPLTGSEYVIADGSVAEGDELILTHYGSVTDVGSVKNSFDYKLTNGEGEDVSPFYEVKTLTGTLSVTARPLTVATESDTRVYDGSYLSKEGYTLTEQTSLAKGHTISMPKYASILNVGKAENSFDFAINDEKGNDVTENYSIKHEWGSLEVTKRPIEISTGGGTWVYDGEEHTDLDHTVGGMGLAAQDRTSLAEKTVIRYVSEVDNVQKVGILNEIGEDVTENYDITYVYGVLSVTKRAISVTTSTVTREYNGEVLVSNGLPDVLVGGDEFVITSSAEIKNVGTVANEIVFTIVNGEGVDVRDSYEIAYTPGSLTVTHRNITFTSGSSSFVYDGQDHTCETVDVGGSGLVSFHRIEIADPTVVNTVTDGLVPNSLTVVIYDGDEDVTENYAISLEKGTLSVTARPITVTTATDEKVYDASELVNTGYDAPELVEGHYISVSSSAGITNFGSVSNTFFAYDILNEKGESVKKNYTVSFNDGTLKISKRPVTLATASASKIYDALPLTAPEWIFVCDPEYPEIEGHRISAAAPTGVIVNVGSEFNSYYGDVFILDADGDDVTENYDVAFKVGELTVEPRPIQVTSTGIELIYDGKEHFDSALHVTSDAVDEPLCEGHVISVLSYSVFKDATEDGEQQYNEISFVILAGTEDVTENYDVTYTAGEVNISKRPITVTSTGIELVYDGKEHSDSALHVTSDAVDEPLCEGHVISVLSYNVFKDATEDGEQQYNEISFVILAGTEDVTKNYDVTYTAGEVNISKRPITVSTVSYLDKYYDGSDHSDHRFTYEGEYGLCDYHSVEVDAENSYVIKNATDGEQINYVVYEIVDGSGDVVTHNYAITEIFGRVNVLKRPITVTSADVKVEVYDGYEHSNTDFSVTSSIFADALCDGHLAYADSYNVFKNATDDSAQKLLNEMTVFITDGYEDVTENYDISYVFGEVSIPKRHITVYTSGYAGVYDGKDHSDPTVYTAQSSPYGISDLHEIKIRDYYKIKNATASPTENTVDFYIRDTVSGENVTPNYIIDITYGEVSVSKRAISIETASIDIVYDGTEHTDYTITVVDGTLCDGHVFEVTEYLTVKNVILGAQNAVKYSIVDGTTDVTGNYSIAESFGTVNVYPREITVESESFSGVYDGMTHGENTVVSGLGLCDGHEIILVDYIPYKDVVDGAENVISFYISDGETDVTKNYSFPEPTYGTVTITAREVTVSTLGNRWSYDGKSHSYIKYETLYGTSFVDSHVIRFAHVTYVTEISTVENRLVIAVYDEDGVDVTSKNYVITYESYGMLEVCRRAVSLQSKSATKVYDGAPLTAPEFTVLGAVDLLNGHTAVADFTGTITEVGSTENTFDGKTLRVVDADGNDVTKYYDLSAVAGVLTVTEDGSDDDTDDGSDDSGNADIDLSGSLLSNGELGSDGLERVFFTVESDADGYVYLKITSYGDLNDAKNGWNAATEYDALTADGLSAYYLSALAFSANGLPASNMNVTPAAGHYALPYYALDGDFTEQMGDVGISGNASVPYYVSYFTPSDISGITVPDSYAAFEAAYSEFVRENYLAVDSETLEFLEGIISENGFDASDPDIIASVARYISSCATYDLEYNRELDKEQNIIVAFMRDYKTGVCRHYASAATLLYRALGIPARYTVGFAGEVTADTPTDMLGAAYHAWVEVYVDGLGWVSVEVTYSNEVTEPDDEKEEIVLWPQSLNKPFDGIPLEAENVLDLGMSSALLAELIEQGYTYEVEVSGSRTEVGRSAAEIVSFRLFDENGNDVTQNYEYAKMSGTLTVTRAEIIISLYENKHEYDGNTYSYENHEYVVTSIPSGVTLVIDSINISGTNVSDSLTLGIINNNISEYITYRVLIDGIDLTDNYTLSVGGGASDYMPFEITRRYIQITTASASKPYDGTPLTNPNYTISIGTLAMGHTLNIEISGKAISKTGNNRPASNTVVLDTIAIMDGEVDVTENYVPISVDDGTLILGTLVIT